MQRQDWDQCWEQIDESLITTDSHIAEYVVGARNVDWKDHAAIHLTESEHKVPDEIENKCSTRRLLEALHIFLQSLQVLVSGHPAREEVLQHCVPLFTHDRSMIHVTSPY